MVRSGRSRGCSSIWALFWAYVYSPHWVGTYFSDAAGPARSPPSLSGPTSWWYRGHKNLENYCPGLQVMPGLYSNSLLQRPTLGRTTLKNQDIRWSGNSMPGYIGRANLNSKRGRHCNLHYGIHYSNTQLKEARNISRKRWEYEKKLHRETV